jgi:hypothetical protein
MSSPKGAPDEDEEVIPLHQVVVGGSIRVIPAEADSETAKWLDDTVERAKLSDAASNHKGTFAEVAPKAKVAVSSDAVGDDQDMLGAGLLKNR